MRPVLFLVRVGLFFVAISVLSNVVGRAFGGPLQSSPSISAAPQSAPAESHDTGSSAHFDPFANILLAIFLVILAAMIGRHLAHRVNQPPVLGELVIGIAIGNIGVAFEDPLCILLMNMDKVGPIFEHMWTEGVSMDAAAQHVFDADDLRAGGVGSRIVQAATGPGAPQFILAAQALWIFSNLGLILLLFMVGLESSVEQMLSVGVRAMGVAIVGVVVPFLLGVGGSYLLLPPSTPAAVHLFLGATLCATSVGITARVFKDLQKLHIQEARIILGAAVIDDVLGLIILAIVIGIVTTQEVQLLAIGKLAGVAFLFLGLVVMFGDLFVRAKVKIFRGLDPRNYSLLLPLALAFLLSYVADQIHLATIVGAFAAGLVIREEHFDEKGKEKADGATLHTRFAPLETLFAPIFFVLVGMEVNLLAFRDPNTILLGGAFVIAAVIGKLACGLAVGAGADAITVGIGMIPRGEVGLIFAKIGKTLNVFDDRLFSAIVLMVFVTTLITPLGLKWSLSRSGRAVAG